MSGRIFEMIVVTLLFGGVIYLLVTYILPTFKNRRHGCIPGPFPLPIIGNLHLFGKDIHKDLTSMSKIYGDIFAIYLGSNRKVIVSSAKAVKEILIEKGTHFAGRPDDNFKLYLGTMGNKDILACDYGPQLKYLRKVFTRGLNLHGFNKKIIEGTVKKHADAMVSCLAEQTGISINPTQYVHLNILNVLMNLVFNEESTFEDPLFLDILKALRLLFSAIKPGPEDVFPWLRYFPNKNIRDVIEGSNIRNKITYKFVEEHRASYVPGIIRDVTDAMLAAEAEELENGGGKMDHPSFMMLINEIFVAGVETTATTIQWMLLFLAKWPDTQDKLRSELQKTDFESLDTEKSSFLPYTFAAIHEAQRLGSVTPIITHKATRDTSLSGYHIPKDTNFLLNFYAVMHDENVFENPDQYIPERWINKSGEYEPNPSILLPFGAGPRVCPGRQLASMVLFIFITKLVTNFFFEEMEGQENSMDADMGLTISPRDLKLRLTRITI